MARKKSIFEDEVDSISETIWVDPEDDTEEVSGGHIYLWRIYRFLFGKYLKAFEEINYDFPGWELEKKDFDDWGINRSDLNEYERDGYITIEKLGKGRSKYHVMIRSTSKPFPSFLDNLTDDERRYQSTDDEY